jgi:hypothetical protein
VPHLSQLTAIVIDVPDDLHEAERDFWAGATGADLPQLSHDEFHGARLRPDLVLLVQRLGEGRPAVHLDFHTDDLAAEIDRLEVLGAVVDDRFDGWVVMTDPAGLRFCVVQPPDGSLDPATCTAWP